MKFAFAIVAAFVSVSKAYTDTDCTTCADWVKIDPEGYPTYKAALAACCYQCNHYSNYTYTQGCNSFVDENGNVVDAIEYYQAKFRGNSQTATIVVDNAAQSANEIVDTAAEAITSRTTSLKDRIAGLFGRK